MRAILAALIGTLLLITPAKAQPVSAFVQGAASSGPACGGYQGPGDFATAANWRGYWGLRAFNAATCGNKAINIRRASDGTNTDISTISTTGKLDVATATTFCNATTCFVTKLYEQSGGGVGDVSQATAGSQAQLAFGCTGLAASTPCLTTQGTGNPAYLSALSITQAQPFTLIGAAKFITDPGGNPYHVIHKNTGQPTMGFLGGTDLAYVAATLANQSVATSKIGKYTGEQAVVNGASSVFTTDSSDGVQTNNSTNPGTADWAVEQITVMEQGFSGTGTFLEAGIYNGTMTGTQTGNINTGQCSFWGYTC